MTQDTLVLPSLSPVGDKPISVMIDARCTSADGGVLLFQDVERRLNLANRLAACLHDPRQPGKITHPLDEILRFRMLAIVAGYPDSMSLLLDDGFFVFLCAQLLEEVGAGFSPMRRRVLCGAEGRIRHDRTWTA